MKIAKKRLIEYLYITLGVILVAFSFSVFLDPNNLVIGGVTGVATILRERMGLDPSLTVLIINGGLLIVGFFLLGKDFLVKTAYGSITLPLFIKLFNLLYDVVNVNSPDPWISDKVLVIIFSAIIMGAGIGIVLKNGGTTGGTEIPQDILYKYFKVPYSLSLWLIDGMVVIVGTILIKVNGKIDPQMLLYALIFIYLSGSVMDQIVFSGFNSKAVYIISDKNEEIKQRILKDFSRGVTQIQVIGGYTNQEKSKLICVLSNTEYYRLKQIIHEYDKNAFFYVVRASEVLGEGFSQK